MADWVQEIIKTHQITVNEASILSAIQKLLYFPFDANYMTGGK